MAFGHARGDITRRRSNTRAAHSVTTAVRARPGQHTVKRARPRSSDGGIDDARDKEAMRRQCEQQRTDAGASSRQRDTDLRRRPAPMRARFPKVPCASRHETSAVPRPREGSGAGRPEAVGGDTGGARRGTRRLAEERPPGASRATPGSRRCESPRGRSPPHRRLHAIVASLPNCKLRPARGLSR